MIELSQEFEHCGRRLTQEEQHEVMRFTRSRLPPILATVVKLLSNVRASLAALNHHTRQQLSQQLVPEVCCMTVECLQVTCRIDSSVVVLRVCVFIAVVDIFIVIGCMVLALRFQ